MDPLSALSIAANVLQFLELGFKIAKKVSEYNEASPDDVPRSMYNINITLPLVLNALDRIKTDAEIGKLDTDTRCILRGVVSGCMKLVTEIGDILGRVKRAPGESLGLKIKKVLGSFKYDENIAEIEKSLQAYVQVLILHQVIDSKEVPAGQDEKKYSNVTEKRAEGFVRREKITRELDAAFAEVISYQRDRPQLVVLKGPQSAGKSQAALDYCREAYKLERFPTVFWLKASSPESLLLSLEGVAAIVRRSSKGSRAEKVAFVTTFLNERWHPWLLVLDDYVPNAFHGTDIATMVPQQGYGGILFTTQYSVNIGTLVNVPTYLTPEEENQLRKSLTDAIEVGHLPAVKDCVNDGVDVNGKIADGQYFLIQAADRGFVEAVRYLLVEGANPEPLTIEGSVLCRAAVKGHLAMIETLLDHEDTHGTRSKPKLYETAFQEALRRNYIDICRTLMSRRGVELTMENREGRSVLYMAASAGSLESIKLFVEKGVLPKNESDWTLLLKQVIWNKHFNIVMYFLETICDLSKTVGQWMLPTAITYHCTDVVRLLLEKGCDPNLADDQGDMPLSVALYEDDEEVTRMLLEKGADPTLEGGTGMRTIARAYRGFYSKAASVLISTPIADPERRKLVFRRMMKKAVKEGSAKQALEVVEAAERTGQSPEVLDYVDSEGFIPLTRAISRDNLPLARLLIKRGSRLDVTNDVGDTVLHTAARYSYDGVVKTLLEVKMHTAVRNEFGNTPLHLAASKGHPTIVKMLLKGGADWKLENNLGETPLDMALDEKNSHIVEILEEVAERG